MIKEEKNYKFYNPADTAEILGKLILKESKYKFKKNKDIRIDWWYINKEKFAINPNLLFGRIIPYSKEKENKEKYLNLVISEFEKLQQESLLLKSIVDKRKELVDELEINGFEKESIISTCSWRLIIGLGSTHPQETSMTLHHIYGIPYIPGSAVKGVTRHWIILNEFNNDENKAQNNDKFAKIFGTQTNEGKVIFMDAYPIDKIKFKIDIMNPHYPNYYSKGESPADWQTPNPIKFLTIEKTKFNFILLSRNKELLVQASEWLKQALQNFGIGAKTSLGYGIFE